MNTLAATQEARPCAPAATSAALSSQAGWFIMLAAAAAELALVAAAAMALILPATGLLAHAVLVAALGLALGSTLRRSAAAAAAPRIAPLFVLATSVLGPIGACGSLLTGALLWAWAARAPGAGVWQAAAAAEPGSVRAQALYRHVMRDATAPPGSDVAPFMDVLAQGSVVQKQAVVALIVGHFEPALAPALRGALNDDDPSVRVLAASGAARIESQMLECAMALEGRRAREPDNAEAAWQLARHLDDHAHSGLLDDSRALTARTRALEMYRECERLRPGSAELRVATLRLFVRLGRDHDAVQTLAPWVQSGSAPADALAWYIEGLFRLRRYAELRQTCRLLHVQGDAGARLSERCREVIAVWACGAAP